MGVISRLLLATMLAFAMSIAPFVAPAARSRAVAAPPAQAGPALSEDLRAVMASASSGDSIRVIVRMQSRLAKPAAWPEPEGPQAAAVARAALVTALQADANAAQRDLLTFLSTPEVDAQVDDVRAYWIFNGLALRATPAVIDAIARREDVTSVRLDKPITLDRRATPAALSATLSVSETLRARMAGEMANESTQATGVISFTRWPRQPELASQAPAPGQVTWGVGRISADKVWRALGVTGRGVVVANVDSGVDWQHPTLFANYRGNGGGPVADHLHNWYDATDEASTYPADTDGHGTHTMGTMVGQNGIGVAPGARWMAAKAFNRTGIGLSSWLHSALQFVLAPGDDPAYAPDIVNNSWGDSNGSNEEFKEDIAALRAAGIFVVFSNGNRGPQPGTVGSPASLPGAVSVGATDREDDVASFSSRGPSPFGEVRPMLSAPGVDVASTFPGGAYLSFNGTSMAAPHVAGAAALVLSALPTMSVGSTLFALTSTAQALAADVPNNDSGWGRLDAYRAVLSVLPNAAIAGVVRDGGEPVPGADVLALDEATGRKAWTITDAQGNYALRMSAGVYTVQAGAFGYFTATSAPRIAITGTVAAVDLNLDILPSGSVRGSVRDAATGAYVTANVRALGTPKSSTSDNNCIPCRYALDLPAGHYLLEVRAVGYKVETREVHISDGGLTDADFALTPAQRIAFVDSGAHYYGSAAPRFREALDALQLGFEEIRIKRLPVDTPTITDLLKYDTVIWSAPFDAPSLVGASDVLSRYLTSGRNLLLTGNDIALFDGGGLLNYQPYLGRLNALYAGQNLDAQVVTGAANGPIAGKVVTISQAGSGLAAPDIVQQLRREGGPLIGGYANPIDGQDGAGTFVAECSRYRAAYYAFGLESIDSAADRADVLGRTLDAFVAPRPPLGIELLPRDTYLTGVGIGQPGTSITHVVRLRNTGDGGVTQSYSLEVQGNRWPARLSATSVTLAPCASAHITVTVDVPADAGWDAGDQLTVLGAIAAAPEYRAVATFSSKTPASILLVDDDRFFDREQDYLRALAAEGNTADRWDTRDSIGPSTSPPLDVLRKYPIVIWFNGYDWFDPIDPAEERVLIDYLEGGGRLFFTSQAALAYTGLSPLVRTYFGVSDIDFTDATSSVLGMPGTPLGHAPFGGSLLPFPYNWNLSASVQPSEGTHVTLRGDSGQPFGLARSAPTADAAGAAWRTMFAPFAVEALNNEDRAGLINRVVGWLSPLGRSSLRADRDAALPGEIVNFTAIIRADDVITPAFSTAHPVSLTIDLADGLTLVSSSLPEAGGTRAGRWAGVLRAGDVLTWTFTAQVSASATPGQPLAAIAHIGLTGAGLRFSQIAPIDVGAPSLTASLGAQPALPDWRGDVTMTVRVTNTAAVDAREVVLHAVAPPSVTLQLLGMPTFAPEAGTPPEPPAQRLVMTVTIPAFGVIERMYRLRMPLFGPRSLAAYQHAVVVDDGGRSPAQALIWLRPAIYRWHFPLMPY